MKVLLRSSFEWKTAKYCNNGFEVEGRRISTHRVLAIINDNAKNYVRCSCCGEVFRKGDRSFDEHREKSATAAPCIGCSNMYTSRCGDAIISIKQKKNGSFVRREKYAVRVLCDNTGREIMSDRTIQYCSKRQCATAHQEPINTIFQKYPGVFDDFITVSMLAAKLNREIMFKGEAMVVHINDHIKAHINCIGIVDYFTHTGYWCDMHYSHKYRKLFDDYYEEKSYINMQEDIETIEKLYQ